MVSPSAMMRPFGISGRGLFIGADIGKIERFDLLRPITLRPEQGTLTARTPPHSQRNPPPLEGGAETSAKRRSEALVGESKKVGE